MRGPSPSPQKSKTETVKLEYFYPRFDEEWAFV